ncbi:MAG: hypothetical protein JXL80_02925 [Planctomycetes bacterium]|nr:hypothetical protein [Planctomycetota bacterium]
MKCVSTTAGRRVTSGLTLVEILATVFIMGLGLIMVAAAFPVGLDQVRQSVEDTQSAMAARSAMEIIRSQNIFQNMHNLHPNDTGFSQIAAAFDVGALTGDALRKAKAERMRENLGIMIESPTSDEWTMGPCQPLHFNHSDCAFRVWNPYRAAYGGRAPTNKPSWETLGEDETMTCNLMKDDEYLDRDEDNKDVKKTYGQAMWPPVAGDLIWRAYLTRLNFGKDELPLFRVTIVVCRYAAVGSEMYVPYRELRHPEGGDWSPTDIKPPKTAAAAASDIGNNYWKIKATDGSVGTGGELKWIKDKKCKAPASARTIKIQGYGNKVCTASTTQVTTLAEGDFMLNTMTGFCHRIAEINKDNQNFTLADDVTQSPTGRMCPVFSNVVGVFYGMLSG